MPSSTAFFGIGAAALAERATIAASIAWEPNSDFAMVLNARLLTRRAVDTVLSFGWDAIKVFKELVNVAKSFGLQASHSDFFAAACWISSELHLTRTKALAGAMATLFDSVSSS